LKSLARSRGYARAALVGNPSDGYHGRTLSAIVRNFWAEVALHESDAVEIVPASDDRLRFDSVFELAEDVRHHGYYGAVRLVKAAIRRFVSHCQSRGLALHDRPFSVRYGTNIPRQVGLAGSSAIVVATLRCLIELYRVAIAREVLPSLALSVERDELGIAAGLQDRVAQVYEGLVYMDFDRSREREGEGLPCYEYTSLDPALLPPLYLSYSEAASEPTEIFHNDIRARFARGEASVVGGMARCAELARQAHGALLARDAATLSRLMDENFDIRRSIYSIAPWQLRMVDVARECGASANFAGSGGAIVGTYEDEAMFARLTARLAEIGCRTVKPLIS
jgi:glucuronokinase